jgi:hypothetical protein
VQTSLTVLHCLVESVSLLLADGVHRDLCENKTFEDKSEQFGAQWCVTRSPNCMASAQWTIAYRAAWPGGCCAWGGRCASGRSCGNTKRTRNGCECEHAGRRRWQAEFLRNCAKKRTRSHLQTRESGDKGASDDWSGTLVSQVASGVTRRFEAGRIAYSCGWSDTQRGRRSCTASKAHVKQRKHGVRCKNLAMFEQAYPLHSPSLAHSTASK